MENVQLIVNPISGNGRGLEVAPLVKRRIESLGFNVAMEVTKSSEHATTLAGEAGSGDIIAVLGGDGTVSQVFKGLKANDVRVLVLAIGTANVIARELDMPLDPIKSCDVLSCHRLAKWDIASCNSQPVIFALSAGFDAETVHRLAKRRKGPITSRLSYTMPVIETFLNLSPKPITLEVDGIKLPQPFSYFLAINTTRYAGGFVVSPDSDPTDGSLNLIALKSFDFFSHLRYGFKAAMGTISEAGDAYKCTFKSLRATSGGPVPVQIDGEAAGHLPVTIELNGRYCTFLMPKKKEAR